MRADTGKRSFFGLLGAAFVAYQLLGIGVCLLLSLLLVRLWTEGLRGTAGDWGTLVPTAVFLAAIAVGAALGLRTLLAQAGSSLRLARHVRDLQLPVPHQLAGAAERAGLSGRVRLVDADEPFSFAYGALWPRVAVSRALFERASAGELDAVLEHEGYHVRNLDPLKVLVARAVPDALFYLPTLRDMSARYTAGRELAADRCALSACGRKPLASALYKVVAGPAWPELGTAAAIGGPELLEVRVAQLETGSEPRIAGVSKVGLLLSLIGAGLLAGSAALSLAASGGLAAVIRTAMPGMDASIVGAASMAACTLPVAIAAWGVYRLLQWRARQPA